MDASGCEEEKGFLFLWLVPIARGWSLSAFITIIARKCTLKLPKRLQALQGEA